MSRPKRNSAKRQTATQAQWCPQPMRLGPVVSVAATIEGLQAQRSKNYRRLEVINRERVALEEQNTAIEKRRLELLRDMDRVTQ